jgi:hypothetical protein
MAAAATTAAETTAAARGERMRAWRTGCMRLLRTRGRTGHRGLMARMRRTGRSGLPTEAAPGSAPARGAGEGAQSTRSIRRCSEGVVRTAWCGRSSADGAVRPWRFWRRGRCRPVGATSGKIASIRDLCQTSDAFEPIRTSARWRSGIVARAPRDRRSQADPACWPLMIALCVSEHLK